jgi:hypothetical protein
VEASESPDAIGAGKRESANGVGAIHGPVAPAAEASFGGNDT